jgi:hypothetical protein
MMTPVLDARRQSDTTADTIRAARTRCLSTPYTTEELLGALDNLLRQDQPPAAA